MTINRLDRSAAAISVLMLAAITVIAFAARAQDQAPVSDRAELAKNKALAIDAFTNIFQKENVHLVERYFGANYISHNAYNPDGHDGVRESIALFTSEGPIEIQVVRALAEGDRVALQNRFDIPALGKYVTFDVLRIEGGLIVEHWDSVTFEQPPNPAGRTLIDGETRIADLDKTIENKARATEFVNHLIDSPDPDFEKYLAADVVQHSVGIGDGIAGLRSYLTQQAESGDPVLYSQLHFSLAEGNFVLTASEGMVGDGPSAFYDLFRFEDGLIVEHWRTVDEIFGPDAPHNQHGKF